MLKRLRKFLPKWQWIDWVLLRLEAFGALLEQYGLRPSSGTVIAVGGAAVTGVWTYLTVPGAAIAVAVGIVVFAVVWIALRLRSLGVGQSKAGESLATAQTSSDQVERNRLKDRMRTLNRATHLLVYSEIERILAARIRARLYDAPPLIDDILPATEMEMKERTKTLRQYVNLIVSNLAASRWEHGLDFAIKSAEAEEEQRLKASQTPTDVNAYVFRDFAIALSQTQYAVAFLRRALAEHDEALSASLSRMREELQHLDPRTFG